MTELASEKSPEETIVLHIVLPDDGFDFTSFASVEDQPETDELIRQRKASLVPSQEYAETIVECLGGTVLRRTWLVSGLIIEIPVQAVQELLDETFFVDLNPEDGEPVVETANEGWGGLDITNGTLSESLFQMGYDGETGGRTDIPDNAIKIGILEVPDGS